MSAFIVIAPKYINLEESVYGLFLLLLVLTVLNVLSYYITFVKKARGPANFWVRFIASIIIIVLLIPYL